MPTCIIADDEPLLAQSLQAELAQCWPELQVLNVAANGKAALAAINEYRPDIAFLDIKMPGMTGLEVAQTIVEDSNKHCLVVFVTAYDEFAHQAFDSAAIDYVLKPVNPQRLEKTITRLKKYISQPSANANDNEVESDKPSDSVLLSQLKSLLSQTQPNTGIEALTHFHVSVGDSIRIIPVNDVLYLQAADKYVIVMTASGENLIREPLKDIIARLNPSQFKQIHRSTVVNMNHVQQIDRDEMGKQTIRLKDAKQRLVVSRLYAHLFKPM
jgi:DNA-binding LytR/AlgR family response regulator